MVRQRVIVMVLMAISTLVGGCWSPGTSQPLTVEERRQIEEPLNRIMFDILVNMMDPHNLSDEQFERLAADPAGVLGLGQLGYPTKQADAEPLVELLRLARAEAIARRAATQPSTRPATVPHDLFRQMREP